ncbi:MAG: hypothetical protein HYY91_05775 [Candidatus Omnitrophica bacterium]|nr:hypothetical protein [Candidatus Omnitrophota bacterium]
MRRVFLLAVALLAAPSSSVPAETERVGILILAHGGSNRWNSMVHKAVREADLEQPTELALGMGMHGEEVRSFQQAVDRLERKQVSRIAVVPLLVSSHSEVYRQFEYLFGLRRTAEWPEVAPLRLEVPIVMGHGLDDHPLVGEVALERAKRLSRRPDRETVVLAAHGPNDETDNQRWLADLRAAAQFVKERGAFRDVLTVTMRDDAPNAVKDQADRQFRELVRAAGEEGRVLIVPVLIARGGIERKIPKILAGLSYAFSGDTLLPDRRVVGWIAQEAGRLAAHPSSEAGEAVVK